MKYAMTWEEAVVWLRSQDDQQDLVRSCYYDDPLDAAAERFRHSEEWCATRELLRSHLPGEVLEIGAGRGICSYAFAKEGCKVTALEPDPSSMIGRGAIERLSKQANNLIHPIAAYGESLPFSGNQFDIVYGRAVLHHARHLPTLCREITRVLRPGGMALFVREPVISSQQDLQLFLEEHPLHALYGGENAYHLSEYKNALSGHGIRLRRIIGPLEDPVNFFPETRAEVHDRVTAGLAKKLKLRPPLARMILAVPGCRSLLTRWASRHSKAPGRLYSFLGVKP